MLRWFTIFVAVIGVAVGIFAVVASNEKPPVPPLARQPSVNPFDRGVAALGFVEPMGRAVSIGVPESGLVSEVLVDVGDRVEQGQVLLRLDDRALKAQLVKAQAAVGAAQSEIERWKALPRAEDVPPLRAEVERAKALLADRQEQLKQTEDAAKRGAATDRDVSLMRFTTDAARAQLDRAAADLARLEAGGWSADLAVAEATLAQRRAEVDSLQLLLDRLAVRAPRAGVVLRRDVEPGQFVTADGGGRTPALIVGDLSRLRVRAQVDEEDIALVSPSSRAVARSRGSVVVETPLKLVRIEPFGRPKGDLSGVTTERVDTRVIDVVFEFVGEPGVPLYTGLAVDVFIEASRPGQASPENKPK